MAESKLGKGELSSCHLHRHFENVSDIRIRRITNALIHALDKSIPRRTLIGTRP